MKKFLSALLAASLALSLSLPAAALEVEDVRELLKNNYVDEIPDDILSLGSVEEILSALGDPYTVYMTAEEYQRFLTSVNGDFIVGIGVSIQNVFDDGYRIMAVLPDSPALEAGLEAGDRIVAVDGAALVSGMDVSSAIGGEEGADVVITVIRRADGRQKDYTLTRRKVTLPIVTYELAGDAGVIDCASFGDSTVETVQAALTELDGDAAVWLMDLRSNPGGTADSAAGSAGLFVGSAEMVYFRDAAGNYNYIYTLDSCPDLTDKPLIVLTSPYSASGAELFAAAARDHGFGIGLGQRSFGKGIAQTVFDDTNTTGLFNGDCLKITTHRFFSPDGVTNHIVGVIPTLLLSVENTPAAALLLSSAKPTRAADYLKLELLGFTFYINQSEAVGETYKAAFTELLEALPPAAVLSKGSGVQSWTAIKPAKLAGELGLDYTARAFTDLGDSPFAQEIQTLAAYQLLRGYEDGAFRPGGSITRAEFAAMLSSALNLSGGSAAFSDVPEGAWFAPYVTAAASRGFLAGDGNGRFRPNDPITYQEMVTVLSSVAAWCSMDGYALANEKLSVEDWSNYYEYADWAQIPARNLAALDALVGGLAPADPGTREVAAGMLCTLMESIHLLWN